MIPKVSTLVLGVVCLPVGFVLSALAPAIRGPDFPVLQLFWLMIVLGPGLATAGMALVMHGCDHSGYSPKAMLLLGVPFFFFGCALLVLGAILMRNGIASEWLVAPCVCCVLFAVSGIVLLIDGLSGLNTHTQTVTTAPINQTPPSPLEEPAKSYKHRSIDDPWE